MASIGHLAMGLTAARLHSKRWGWRAAVAFTALSFLPDADVIAFALGIPYADPLGHRGASHSLVFAALCGVIAWAVTRSRHASLLSALTVASHPLLDAITDGGLGVALLWPLSNARYFAPWQPLPVAPIGLGMASSYGLYVLAVETLCFLPLWLFALWPRTVLR